MNRLSHILLAMGLCAAFLYGCGADRGIVKTGDPAKDFRLNSLTRERFYLNQQAGRVVVLVFWTTWCSSCKQELVELKTFKDRFAHSAVTIASICTDPEDMNIVKEIVESLELTYPVLLDEGARTAKQYNIRAYPMTIVIDQDGIVSLIRPGYSPAIMKQIAMKVENLLSGEVSAP